MVVVGVHLNFCTFKISLFESILTIRQVEMILAEFEVFLERPDQCMYHLKSLKGIYNGLLQFCRRTTAQKLTQNTSSTSILQIRDVPRRGKFH